MEHDQMNPHDREILEFARRWAPFGGPRAADILVEFGMTPSRFAERLEELWRPRIRASAGGHVGRPLSSTRPGTPTGPGETGLRA
ncbi:DUF3263 domain-containing protein [Rhodococcus sp. DK17]|uniref:DUF3263 domain-containing protein n=2 Tax=Nocardiaceae TaxID=85025 RepID=UPI0009FFB045